MECESKRNYQDELSKLDQQIRAIKRQKLQVRIDQLREANAILRARENGKVYPTSKR